jgi:hypothetical protein
MNKPALIIMCAACRKIRNDEGAWIHAGSQATSHAQGQYSHTICPECFRRLYPEFVDICGLDKAKGETE